MIRVKRPIARHALDRIARVALIESHRRARRDLAPGHPSIQSRWKYFRSQRPDDAGQKVFEALLTAFNHKCVYCEQVAPRTIDHVFPKAAYPSRMFKWTNFLAACHSCNISRGEGLPLGADGAPLLLDPTRDEPLDYWSWDSLTGAALDCPQQGRRERAEATRVSFSLHLYNDERLHKAKDLRFLLARVIREEPVSPETMERLRGLLLPSRPWLGVVREILLRPRQEAEHRLVEAALEKLPEMRGWVSSWLRPPAWAAERWPALPAGDGVTQ